MHSDKGFELQFSVKLIAGMMVGVEFGNPCPGVRFFILDLFILRLVVTYIK